MKTKAKLTLAISVMSAAVLAAGVTSTFAWFTTQSKATFTTGTLTVNSVSDIKIEVTKLGFNTANDGTLTGDITFVGDDEPLGIVSSAKGDEFYAPIQLNNDGTYSDFEKVGTASTTDDDALKGKWTYIDGTEEKAYANQYVSYVSYRIKVTANKEDSSRTLSWTLKTPEIHEGPNKTASETLAKAYRISFGEGSAAAAPSTPTIYASEIKNYKAVTSDGIPATNNVTTVALTSNVVTATTHKTGDENGISAYYYVSVWVEGMDAAATNNIAGGTITTDLEFSLA